MAKLSRRDFLKIMSKGSAAVASCAYVPRFLVESAHAQSAPGLKVVNVFLSGGCDWFLAHERTGNGAFMDTLRQVRPTLSVPVAARRPLGSSEFTVHNRLATFESAYAANQLAVIMSAGVPVSNTGSHEEATNHFARGVRDGRSTERTGWMQRVAQNYFNSTFQLVDLRGGSSFTRTGDFGAPTDFRGLAANDLSGYGFNATARGESGYRIATAFAALSQAPGAAEALAVHKSWDEVEGSVQQVASIITSTVINPAFPTTSIGNQLRDAFRALVGLPTRLVYTSTGGFDVHANSDPQGQAVNTPMGQSRLFADLDAALNAFRANCVRAGIWNDVVVVVNSEFARTNRENGNKGVDHGDASAVYVLGGNVLGGHYGPAPTAQDLLRPQNGVDAQVSIADIYADLTVAMGFDNAKIFPGFARQPIGFMRA